MIDTIQCPICGKMFRVGYTLRKEIKCPECGYYIEDNDDEFVLKGTWSRGD